jgi:hypothetical protein
MKKTTIDKLQKIFLLIAAIGLIPIALSYGVIPEKSLSYLFNITVSEINLIHILRAIMGLYLALILFWFIGAFKLQLRQAAIYSLVVFMFGLATGRVISLIFEGIPNWLLLAYLALEISFGILGLVLVKKRN